ncbi:MAG: alcohol dehydrogenase catalytic domain-containing protein [Candidatus Sumerlaeaceae bacterium]|nr:alcohol dehydrogenase catalytic domain-containing protein [Candidatus Sumerlaeaceae bacterium]
MEANYPAAVLLQPHEIQLEERRLPAKLLAHEVLIEVAYAGVCGTDIAIFSGDYRVPLPLVLGHEFSGRVVACGPGAAASKLIGKRVVAEINATCVAWKRRKLCAACARGLTNHCQQRTVVGIVGRDGAFSHYVRVPVGCVHVLPDSLSLEQAVFVEPLAAAIRTFDLTPLREGNTVVVLGCGRLGKLVSLVASRYGFRVIAVARRAETLEPIKNYVWRAVCVNAEQGCSLPRRGRITNVRSPEELVIVALDATKGLGADMVVEATGDPNALSLATKLVRPQGTIALKSTPGVVARTVDTTLLAVDEVRVQGSRCGPFAQAIRFLETHRLPSAEWISARYPLSHVADAIEAARYEAKVVIEVAGGI